MGFNWVYIRIFLFVMLEQINNFAGFNLAAILFALIGGGVFMIIFHYLLMPIFSFILIKPLASIVINTWEFFDSAFSKKDEKNEVSEIYSTVFGSAIAIKIDERFISSKLQECEEQVVYKNAEIYYAKWLESLRDQAFIEIFYDKL